MLIPFPKIEDLMHEMKYRPRVHKLRMFLIQLEARIIITLLVCFLIAMVCLSITAIPLLVWILWNWLVPIIFVRPILVRHITFLQACGVVFLYLLLFKYPSWNPWSPLPPHVFDFIDTRTWARELYNKVVGIISIPALWATICLAGPLVVVMLNSLFIYLLWNWLVPLIFVQPVPVAQHLTFLQAWGVGVVCSLLFKPIRSGNQPPKAASQNEARI